jgi:hypothetical protein
MSGRSSIDSAYLNYWCHGLSGVNASCEQKGAAVGSHPGPIDEAPSQAAATAAGL